MKLFSLVLQGNPNFFSESGSDPFSFLIYLFLSGISPDRNGGKTMDVVGYVGIKIEKAGTVHVCHECSTASLQQLNARSYSPVYSSDVYISHNGGMTCVICEKRFI
jgi:hypothetical protein